MRAYINIFLTLVMPLSLLFTVIAIGYFSLDYDLNKAIRLGVLAGVMSSIAFSFILAFIIQVTRMIRQYQFKKRIRSANHPKKTMPTVKDHTIYERNQQEKQERASQTSTKADFSSAIVETFMLLMDQDLAYEVSLKSINDKKIADIIDQNEKEKSIHLRKNEEEIHIKISSLTKHTAQVLISSTKNKETIKKIITILKAREHSFMQY